VKRVLIAATFVGVTVVGFGCASAQGLSEPQKGPVAAHDPPAPHESTQNLTATPQPPETTGRAPSEAAAKSSEEEDRAAAEARRARAAVGRTLDRTRELSQSDLD
jgi:hypothetical protein